MFKKKVAVWCLLLAVLTVMLHVPALAHKANKEQAHKEHDAHTHGHAVMTVAVDKGQVTIKLKSPLESFISFEHAPKTAKQKEEARQMSGRLHQADQVFVFPAAAQCKVEKIALTSNAIDAAFLRPDAGQDAGQKPSAAGKKAAKNTKKKGKQDHGDLEAEYIFGCGNIAALDNIIVQLFSVAPNLRELDVQMVTPKGQAAVELTPSSNRLRW